MSLSTQNQKPLVTGSGLLRYSVSTVITYRRHYLDQLLMEVTFRGSVLDVGGERATTRGVFRPPQDSSVSWKYLNPDPKTDPDVLSGAEALPFPDKSFDMVKLTEVLEHIAEPNVVLNECCRVLKEKGSIIASVPFLLGVHGDPDDFSRWTPTALSRLFSQAGFRQIKIIPMGGFVAVCADLFEQYCHRQFEAYGRLSFPIKCFRFLVRRLLGHVLLGIDTKLDFKNEITTGYFIVAVKE